jgi:hypothetical protein
MDRPDAPGVRPEDNPFRALGLLHGGEHRPTREENEAAFEEVRTPVTDALEEEMGAVREAVAARGEVRPFGAVTTVFHGPGEADSVFSYQTADGYLWDLRLTVRRGPG